MPELAIEHVDAEIIDAGDGVHIPRSWGAVVTGLPEIPGAVHARIVYDPILRRAVAESVRVDRGGLGDEVTTTLLRDVRVQAIVQWAAALVVRIDRDGGDPESYVEYITRLRRDDGRSNDDNLREAVRLYRLGSVINDGPLKLVSEELGVSISTATRMMNRARVAGLVDEETGREVYVRHANSSFASRPRDPSLARGHQVRRSAADHRVSTSVRAVLALELPRRGFWHLRTSDVQQPCVDQCAQISRRSRMRAITNRRNAGFSPGNPRVFCPQLARIPSEVTCFCMFCDVVELSKTRVIPRKLPLDEATEKAPIRIRVPLVTIGCVRAQFGTNADANC